MICLQINIVSGVVSFRLQFYVIGIFYYSHIISLRKEVLVGFVIFWIHPSLSTKTVS